MNKFEEIYKNIILKDIFFKGRKEALIKWGNTQEADEYIEKFMNKNNGIRLKVSTPYNDIDYWHSKKNL